MKIWHRYLTVLLAALITGGAAYGYYTYKKEHSSDSDSAQVRITVEGLGDQLQQVPLIAPHDILKFAMDKYYALYVRPDTLSAWENDPKNAPGRLTSSPWPDRIEVVSATKNQDGTYTVDANIVDIARTATSTAVVDRMPVRFTLARGPDGWQITGYQKR